MRQPGGDASRSGIFTPDFKPTPYWWETTPPLERGGMALPAEADVVVVGSGYTGLHAALEVARGGRSALILDAGAAGSGCSTRNGGQVSTSVKPSLKTLAARHGEARARAIREEGTRSLEWLKAFVAEESIDCDLRHCGRFLGAHSRRAFAALEREVAAQPKGQKDALILVSPSEQAREIATDVYCGGVVAPHHASLDPGRYHRGVLEKALAAGAELVTGCAVTGLKREGAAIRVSTERGTVLARDVVLATNGYTPGAFAWLRHRIIPIGSYIIATEPLAEGLMDRLLPSDRMIVDSRKVIYYYRASPDRTRILFGGRVLLRESDPHKSAPLLLAELIRIFPELAGIRVTHSWMGFVAFTFDKLMHTGANNHVHYGAGYCGSGVAMAGYLGMNIGRRILGTKDATAFDGLSFPRRPYYFGNPWFLSAAVGYYRTLDRIG